MPFTPFHLGPGAAIKAVGGPSVSFVVFGFTQMVMDLEPLLRLWRDDPILHGVSHTYLGATGIGLICLLLGYPLGRECLRLWNRRLSPGQHRWLGLPPTISWSAAGWGAFLGAYSHVLLDSLMHADMRPLSPFMDTNPLLVVRSPAHLEWLCVVFGVWGLLILGLRASWVRTPRGDKPAGTGRTGEERAGVATPPTPRTYDSAGG